MKRFKLFLEKSSHVEITFMPDNYSIGEWRKKLNGIATVREGLGEGQLIAVVKTSNVQVAEKIIKQENITNMDDYGPRHDISLTTWSYPNTKISMENY